MLSLQTTFKELKMKESILHQRYPVRVFEDGSVNAERMKEIIAGTHCAPLWCDSRSRKAWVVTGETAGAF